MENKYQESLNRLHTSIYSNSVYLNYSSSSQPFEEDIKTLQELIDSHEQLNNRILDLKYQKNCAIIEKQLYEKALDKACEKLEYVNNNVYFLDNNPMNYFDKEKWKRYLLGLDYEESEKQ